MLQGFLILIACLAAGEALALATGLPVPGAVVGLVILFAIRKLRGQVPEHLRQTSAGLLQNLGLLFVPAGVGVIAHLDTIGPVLPRLASVLVLSTVITIAVTALVGAALLAITRREQDGVRVTRAAHDRGRP